MGQPPDAARIRALSGLSAGIADVAAKAGRRRSAGEAYLRASGYYRASYFFDRADLTGSFLHTLCGRRPGAPSELGSTISISTSTW
jgi:hypothetical protein